MNAYQDQLGGLGRNNILFLLKGAKNILMIWVLYLFILSNDF